MAKNNGKNISKTLSGKYSQKLLGNAKKSVRDAFKTASKRAIQNIYNKIIQNIVFKIVKNWHGKEIAKEKYISPEKRQEIVGELRLK